ncbi:unnamed protein product, partial [Amoebophrya sp. A120]|eukprot:GSA120T00019322001.1
MFSKFSETLQNVNWSTVGGIKTRRDERESILAQLRADLWDMQDAGVEVVDGGGGASAVDAPKEMDQVGGGGAASPEAAPPLDRVRTAGTEAEPQPEPAEGTAPGSLFTLECEGDELCVSTFGLDHGETRCWADTVDSSADEDPLHHPDEVSVVEKTFSELSMSSNTPSGQERPGRSTASRAVEIATIQGGSEKRAQGEGAAGPSSAISPRAGRSSRGSSAARRSARSASSSSRRNRKKSVGPPVSIRR